MSLPSDPKCKLCRREGEKLFLKGEKCFSIKCPINRRNYAPGVHGPAGSTKRGGKQSNYAKQFREKQKLKRTYILNEQQFRRYYDEAMLKSTDTAEAIMQRLETRLDNVVYRLGFSPSRVGARQLISHGHIALNGRRTDVGSVAVRKNDVISIQSHKQTRTLFTDLAKTLNNKSIPGWLVLNIDKLEGKVVGMPSTSDWETTANIRAIVEFYSR